MSFPLNTAFEVLQPTPDAVISAEDKILMGSSEMEETEN